MRNDIFILAFVTVFSVTFMSCNNDDGQEDKTDYPVNLNTPSNAENSLYCELPNALVASSESNLQLKSFEITESGKIIVELRDALSQKPVYVMGDVSLSGNEYHISGDKMNGTITLNPNNARITRTSNSQVGISITILLEEVVSYTTEDGQTVESVVTKTTNFDEEVMNRLSRTWNVLGAIVDIKGESIKAYEEFESHNGIFYLKDVLDEALQQGIDISDDAKEALKRKVKSVTITKSQKFIINYVDGSEDVADWTWANSEKTRINIRLIDETMGNLFLSNDTKILISFRDNCSNFRLETNIIDNSGNHWEAFLTIKLQSAD